MLIPKDEFGEEAADGLGRLSREEAAEDLRELSGRLERRLESSRRRPRRIWLPAAAAVVTVLVASALYISLFRDRGEWEPELAMADKKMSDSASVALAEEGKTDTVLIAMAADSVSDTVLIAMADSPEKGDGTRDAAGMKSMRRADMSRGKALPPPPTDQAGGDAVPPAVMTDDELHEVVVKAQHEEAAGKDVRIEAISVVQREEPGAEKVIAETPPPKGQVPAGEEVIVVALPATQQEKQAAGEVVAGVQASARHEEAVAAEAAPVMSKKTETARAASARTAAADTVRPDGPAEPVGGWEAFNSWIRPNMGHAKELTSPVNRLVVMNFKVKTDSTLYDIKVVRTPDDSYTNLALWLLREGPKWTPAVRDGQVVEEKVTVSIVFK